MKIRNVILSWDFAIAVALTVTVYFAYDAQINNGFAKDVYGIVVSVLSIVFSIYFAALSIIISSSDNDFIRFLEEDGSFTQLINSLKFTLLSLFIALAVAIYLYIHTSYLMLKNATDQSHLIFCVFIFLTAYSLSAVVLSALDSIKFAHSRARFLTKP